MVDTVQDFLTFLNYPACKGGEGASTWQFGYVEIMQGWAANVGDLQEPRPLSNNHKMTARERRRVEQLLVLVSKSHSTALDGVGDFSCRLGWQARRN